jgi:Bacterial alpha-L-rhamnosidase 6 hairpin glycosidase domain
MSNSANSPRPDGILPMSVVGEIEYSGATTIPDWSLYWIRGVHNLLRYTADRRAIETAAPRVRRILEWYLPYLGEGGVIAGVSEWNLVDWSSILLTGESAVLTGLWARSLRDYADIATFLGNPGDAAWARDLRAQAEGGFERFWDEARGTYVDHVLDGKRQAPASQLAGAFAIGSDLAPQDRWSRILDWIADPQRQVVRSWIGGHGGYDQEKILEQMRGVQRTTGTRSARPWSPSRSPRTSYTTRTCSQGAQTSCWRASAAGRCSWRTTTPSASAGAGAPRPTAGAPHPRGTSSSACSASPLPAGLRESADRARAGPCRSIRGRGADPGRPHPRVRRRPPHRGRFAGPVRPRRVRRHRARARSRHREARLTAAGQSVGCV